MSAQDRTEQVLRDIHILLANSELYDKETNKIIIDKKEMLELLSRLNTGIYDMMDEYGLTEQGRDRAEREARKVGEEIIRDASQKAERNTGDDAAQKAREATAMEEESGRITILKQFRSEEEMENLKNLVEDARRKTALAAADVQRGGS